MKKLKSVKLQLNKIRIADLATDPSSVKGGSGNVIYNSQNSCGPFSCGTDVTCETCGHICTPPNTAPPLSVVYGGGCW